jgi:hypothetical protein
MWTAGSAVLESPLSLRSARTTNSSQTCRLDCICRPDIRATRRAPDLPRRGPRWRIGSAGEPSNTLAAHVRLIARKKLLKMLKLLPVRAPLGPRDTPLKTGVNYTRRCRAILGRSLALWQSPLCPFRSRLAWWTSHRGGTCDGTAGSPPASDRETPFYNGRGFNARRSAGKLRADGAGMLAERRHRAERGAHFADDGSRRGIAHHPVRRADVDAA